MSLALRGLVAAILLAFAGAAFAQGGGELAPLAAWVGKSPHKAKLDGKVARALGLNSDGTPMDLTAVTTAYLDGSRIVYLVQNQILFSQGKGAQGQYFLANASGTLVRAVQWVPTSANPQPLASAAAMPTFTDAKKFWKDQLGRPVR